MNSLTIDLNEQHLKKIEQELLSMPKEAPNALKKAVNATARKAGTKLASKARRRYATDVSGMKRNAGEEGMKLKIATTASLGATIEVKGQMKEISDFKVEPFVVPEKKEDRVANLTAKVLKSSGMKGLTKNPIPFVAKFKSGHVAVVERVPGKKMKSNPKKDFIKKLLSPSLPHMIGNEEVYEKTEPEIEKILEEHITKELLKLKEKQ